MTALAPAVDRETQALYPAIPDSYFGRCTHCLQRRDDIAVREHPEDRTELRRLCARCARALAAGQTIELPADELTEMWPWLARQHQNYRASETIVDERVVDDALHNHSPLGSVYGWAAFEELIDALLKLQEAEHGDVDLLTLEPEWRDADRYENHLRGLIDDAVHKLIGGAA